MYAGFFVADGKLQDLCVYPVKDCARDTIRESMDEWTEANPGKPITDSGVLEIDDDGNNRQQFPVE
jgi:hypothetical protein